MSVKIVGNDTKWFLNEILLVDIGTSYRVLQRQNIVYLLKKFLFLFTYHL